jgi:hypothetical protein
MGVFAPAAAWLGAFKTVVLVVAMAVAMSTTMPIRWSSGVGQSKARTRTSKGAKRFAHMEVRSAAWRRSAGHDLPPAANSAASDGAFDRFSAPVAASRHGIRLAIPSGGDKVFSGRWP